MKFYPLPSTFFPSNIGTANIDSPPGNNTKSNNNGRLPMIETVLTCIKNNQPLPSMSLNQKIRLAGEVLSVLDRVGLHAPNKEEFQEELMLSIIALKPEQETIETGSEPTVEPDTRPTLMGFCRIVKAGDLQFIMNFLTSAVNLETSAYAHVKHLTDGWVMDASHGVITKVTLGELTDIYNVIYPKSGTTPRQVQDALTKHGFGKLNTIYKDGGHVYGYPIKWR